MASFLLNLRKSETWVVGRKMGQELLSMEEQGEGRSVGWPRLAWARGLGGHREEAAGGDWMSRQLPVPSPELVLAGTPRRWAGLGGAGSPPPSPGSSRTGTPGIAPCPP